MLSISLLVSDGTTNEVFNAGNIGEKFDITKAIGFASIKFDDRYMPAE